VTQRTRTEVFDYGGVSREIPINVRTLSTPGGATPRTHRGAPDGKGSVSSARVQRPRVRFCLVFERELLSVPVMRQVLGDTLRGIGVNEDSVGDILLAATEACTNVVLHAGHSARAYTVAATVDRGACRVEVTDAGQGCGRHKRGAGRSGDTDRTGGDLTESGRGFEIMQATMDAVTLRSAPGQGTQVVLDKRIRWESLPSPGGRPRIPQRPPAWA
jgi:serine/threonine-protein kinase RsbW